MSQTPQPARHPLVQALLVVGGMLAAMWALEGIDYATFHSLDQYGIHPRDLTRLGNIALAPWLHFGWVHLTANSGPFLVLGVLTYLSGRGRFLVATSFAVLGSGILVWLISPTQSVTAGASGVVFGWLAYLLVRGFYSRRPAQIAIGVLVLIGYGGILSGVLPGVTDVSWQGHLGGAVGGAVAAWYLHGRAGRRAAARP